MDQLLFRFSGGLADTNRMDFYEAARFQYAAARLTVKLDQFRRTGQFPKRVTSSSRTNINLFPYEKGSFNLKIEADQDGERPLHVDVPLTALWTYVLERVFQPTETNDALSLIDDNALRAEFFDLVENQVFDSQQAIALIRSQLDKRRELTNNEQQLLDRLIAETERRAYLESHRDLLAQISPTEDAELMTMATPLLAELAVPLRRSAKSIIITSIDDQGSRPVLWVDSDMANSIDSIEIDRIVTNIDLNIVQYNKESGWGKFRNSEWDGIPSFSVPADRKANLKHELLKAMREEMVSASAYFVRSKSSRPLRLIIVGLNEIDDENSF